MALIKISNTGSSEVIQGSFVLLKEGSTVCILEVQDSLADSMCRQLQNRGYSAIVLNPEVGAGYVLQDVSYVTIGIGAAFCTLYKGAIDPSALTSTGMLHTTGKAWFFDPVSGMPMAMRGKKNAVESHNKQQKATGPSYMEAFVLFICYMLGAAVLTTLVRLLFSARKITAIESPPEMTYQFRDLSDQERKKVCEVLDAFVREKKDLVREINDIITAKYDSAQRAVAVKGGAIEKPCLLKLQNDECTSAEEYDCIWEMNERTAQILHDIGFALKDKLAKIESDVNQTTVECI